MRTRAVTASSVGRLEWIERLILELKGPIGSFSHPAMTMYHMLPFFNKFCNKIYTLNAADSRLSYNWLPLYMTLTVAAAVTTLG